MKAVKTMKKIYIESRLVIVLLIAFIAVSYIFTCCVLAFFNKISWTFCIATGVLCIDCIIAWFWVVLPYRHAKHLLSLFATGYSFTGIFEERYPFNKEMEGMQKRIKELCNTDEMMTLSKRQAQFIALQNQINPHFLYNTLEGIRSEALTSGLNTVANMAEALSTFFRYTISQVENLVTLKMELDNTKNYFFIQQYRFGNKLQLKIDIDDDVERVLKYKIPKLTLQPIVENSIIHGLEDKVEGGHILIKVITTDKRLLITISDDGIGMNEDRLEKIQSCLVRHSVNNELISKDGKQGGIALQNVNNRIKILFGEEYGLSIESCLDVGTDVHISIPCTEETEI